MKPSAVKPSAVNPSAVQSAGAPGRSLADFTVELDVYSGPYEWLLALIMKDELEIFEIPLRELVETYLTSHGSGERPHSLERDTDFVSSAASLVLLKSRTLSPIFDAEPEAEEEALTPDQLAEKLTGYLRIRRGAESLRERFAANAGFYPTAQTVQPRPGRLKIRTERLEAAARRALSRIVEPPVRHLGPITVTVQELAALIRTSLARGPVSFEVLVRDMDRLHSAVAFAAALSLAHEGRLRLLQTEPLGPLTLEAPA
ncbi:MAG TPA: segregation/condensation protein A [Rubrobacteraceae bacterium]|nr:segregation/condensation protein A [Rubrobacteraceae bacterium]